MGGYKLEGGHGLDSSGLGWGHSVGCCGYGAINAGLPCLAAGTVIFSEVTPLREVSYTSTLVRT